jgi:hypothetical protein
MAIMTIRLGTAQEHLRIAAKLLEAPIATEDLAEFHDLVLPIVERILTAHHRGGDPDARAVLIGLHRLQSKAHWAQESVDAIRTGREG